MIVRSTFIVDDLTQTAASATTDTEWRVSFSNWRASVIYYNFNLTKPSPIALSARQTQGWHHSTRTLMPQKFDWAFWTSDSKGFSNPDASGRTIAVGIALWPLMLLFAILPTLRADNFLRTRRKERVGLCANCGYDLRATPQRCPECGTIPATARAAAPINPLHR